MAHVVFSLHWCALYLLLMIADRAAGLLHCVHLVLLAWVYSVIRLGCESVRWRA
jgi:hypothetical protein